jgi:hypothetical protein
MDAFCNSACGRIATLAPDEVVVAQPQRGGMPPLAIAISSHNVLFKQQLTSRSRFGKKLAGDLLSLEWLSQPPSERS